MRKISEYKEMEMKIFC